MYFFIHCNTVCVCRTALKGYLSAVGSDYDDHYDCCDYSVLESNYIGSCDDSEDIFLAACEDDSQPDPDPASVYMSVIRQQTSIGCWKLNVELSHSLSISLDKLHNAAPLKVGYVYNIYRVAQLKWGRLCW